MLATWPMVLAALGAGVVIGLLAFGQPPAQQSKASAGRAAATSTQPAKAQAPATEAAHKASDPARPGKIAPAAAAKQDQQTCEQTEWPYRDAFCLDRTVKSPQAIQMVVVRQADPTIVLSDKQEAAPQETQKDQNDKDQDGAQKQETAPRPKPVQTTTVPAKRQEEAAPPPRRRAGRGRSRQRRVWADSPALPPEARDLWDDAEPRAYTERNGRIIYVYPERRYFEPRYLPPRPRGPFDDW